MSTILKEMSTLARHGAALDAARALFPRAAAPWLDLSTGINAVAYPIGSLAASAWERLPEDTDLHALEAIAARRYAAHGAHVVVAAPGTQALIQRMPAVCGGRDVRALGRFYGEVERVFRGADRHVRIVPRLEALYGADVAVVVNPNASDGHLVPAEDLLALADRVGTLIVDEGFIDALPPIHSVIPRLSSPRTIVLRSFGKMYGLAGLRLGFAVVCEEIACRLRAMLGPWPVSGPALAIGASALADESWLAEARARLATDAARLMFHLRSVGGTFLGGTNLFSLVGHPAAPALFMALAQAGILTRPFIDEPRWLRFGFPGTEDDWARLADALAAFRRDR